MSKYWVKYWAPSEKRWQQSRNSDQCYKGYDDINHAYADAARWEADPILHYTIVEDPKEQPPPPPRKS